MTISGTGLWMSLINTKMLLNYFAVIESLLPRTGRDTYWFFCLVCQFILVAFDSTDLDLGDEEEA